MPDAMLLFPEDFAAPRRIPPQAPPAPPAPTEADLTAARAEGYRVGMHDGEAAARERARAGIAETLAAIAARLQDARAAALAGVECCAEALARLLLDAVGVALPTLRAQQGEAELRRVVEALLPVLAREVELTVRVHPTLVQAAADALAALPEQAGRPRIVASDAIAPGDAEISWGEGRAVRDSDAAWRRIVDALRPLGLLPPADAME